MANYPQELAQDAVCQSHTGHMTGLWFLPTRPVRLNTIEWMNMCVCVCVCVCARAYVYYVPWYYFYETYIIITHIKHFCQIQQTRMLRTYWRNARKFSSPSISDGHKSTLAYLFHVCRKYLNLGIFGKKREKSAWKDLLFHKFIVNTKRTALHWTVNVEFLHMYVAHFYVIHTMRILTLLYFIDRIFWFIYWSHVTLAEEQKRCA